MMPYGWTFNQPRTRMVIETDGSYNPDVTKDWMTVCATLIKYGHFCSSFKELGHPRYPQI